MQALIEDLLMYSRAKNTDRIFETINLSKIVSEVKKDLEEVIREKKAVINAERLGNVVVIPSQFKQLFQNLISNAIKYSKPGVAPVVTVKSTAVHSSKLKHLKLAHQMKYWHISVADNGIGFDQQYSDRIFEVFQRLHTPDKFAGTGMGLAICKRIVENHNGIISATGNLEQGSSFDIYIPSTRVSEAKKGKLS
jgi:signal transduction histidine kinase